MNAITKNAQKAGGFVVVMLVALMILGTAAPAFAKNNDVFVDVPTSHWAYRDIIQAYEDGAVQGTGYANNGQRIFDPNGKVTMAQFMTIVTRAFYESEIESNLSSGSWYAKNYGVATNHNLFNGVVNCQGDTEVTREVMAQITYNVMVDKNIELPASYDLVSVEHAIPDITSVSGINKNAVLTCYYWELITGINDAGSFAPKELMNRAQTAVIYGRLKIALGGSVENVDSGAEDFDPMPGTGANDNTSSTQTPAEDSSSATGGVLTNGQPVTEANVIALMNEYKNGKKPGSKAEAAGFKSYVDCAKYDAYTPTYYLNPFGYGTECAKFAFAFWDDLFGDVPMREISNFEDIRPGDLLQFSGHWSISTENAFYYNADYLCTRTVDGGSAGEIGWGNVNAILNMGNLLKAYTRYPN